MIAPAVHLIRVEVRRMRSTDCECVRCGPGDDWRILRVARSGTRSVRTSALPVALRASLTDIVTPPLIENAAAPIVSRLALPPCLVLCSTVRVSLPTHVLVPLHLSLTAGAPLFGTSIVDPSSDTSKPPAVVSASFSSSRRLLTYRRTRQAPTSQRQASRCHRGPRSPLGHCLIRLRRSQNCGAACLHFCVSTLPRAAARTVPR
jgi:hypothetical protein